MLAAARAVSDLKMQAPIEWLPDEVLELLFRFLDPKTLLMAVSAVSAWSGRRQHGDAPLLARGCSLGRRPLQECGVVDWRGWDLCGALWLLAPVSPHCDLA